MDSESHSNGPLAVPVITGVVDSNFKPIPPNGTSDDTVLTLSGSGPLDTAVIIADNNTPVALALANEQGEWVKSVFALVGRHSYTVAPRSLAWVVTVNDANLPPVITGVRDSLGEVDDGGSTYDTQVTLEGTAAVDQRVEILDGEEVLGSVTAIAGYWSLLLSSLTFKGYRIKARGLYGSIPESSVRTFGVIYRGEDFETGTPGVIPANTTMEFPAMWIMPVDKDASLTIDPDAVAEPFITQKAVSFADDSVVRFILKSPVNTIRFGAFASASIPGIMPPGFACFDEQGVLIIDGALDFGMDYAAWHDLVSLERKIKTLALTAHPGTSAFVVDNFTF